MLNAANRYRTDLDSGFDTLATLPDCGGASYGFCICARRMQRWVFHFDRGTCDSPDDWVRISISPHSRGFWGENNLFVLTEWDLFSPN